MVNSKFPLEIEVREKYKTIFFGGKKRYAGLTYDNTIIVRGLEVRRGDWCELAKRLQNEIIEVVLKERNIEKAKRIAIEIINKIENGEVGTEDLTYTNP
jgi:DNA polymerase elongation subunit (family B)